MLSFHTLVGPKKTQGPLFNPKAPSQPFFHMKGQHEELVGGSLGWHNEVEVPPGGLALPSFLHNFMVAADSAVVLFELNALMFNGIRLEPTNKRFNSAYLPIKYLISRKIHSNTF